MTKTFLCCVLVMTVVMLSRAETHKNFSGSEAQAAVVHGNQALKVTSEVTRQTFCHTDDEAYMVRLDILLKLTNTSKNPMILSKDIEVRSIRVAKNLTAAAKGDFEYDSVPDYFPSDLPKAPGFARKPDSTLFVILKPGEEYETYVTTAVYGAVMHPSRTGQIV